MTKFELGNTVMTRGVDEALEDRTELENIILQRHAEGDWGDLDEHDVSANEDALENGGRLFSVYHLANGTKIYVITEWDRSVTTALLPQEY